jgi:hypothetical protein
MWDISGVAEDMLAFLEGFCFMELIGWLVDYPFNGRRDLSIFFQIL